MAISSVIATINGEAFTLVYNADTGLYEATIVAPQLSSFPQLDHKYGIVITATDDAGNATSIDRNDPNFGSELAIRVYERVAPVITPVLPTEGCSVLQSNPDITFYVSDNDSGLDWSTLVLKVNGVVCTDTISHRAQSGQYICNCLLTQTLADGPNNIDIDITDNDGNVATSQHIKFTVDTVNPALNVSFPEAGYATNNEHLTVVGSTDDVTSPPVDLVVSVNGVDQGTVKYGGTGDFTHQVLLNAYFNDITITATDQSGRSTTITRRVILDQVPPLIISVDVTPDTLDAGRTYIVRANVTDE